MTVGKELFSGRNRPKIKIIPVGDTADFENLPLMSSAPAHSSHAGHIDPRKMKFAETLLSLIPFITDFLSDDGERYYKGTTGLVKQKNVWEQRAQNLFILICRYLGSQNLQALDFNTGELLGPVSNEPDFQRLKKTAREFLKPSADVDLTCRKRLQEFLNDTARQIKHIAIYPLLSPTRGKDGQSKNLRTQEKNSANWQSRPFTVIVSEWIESLDAEKRKMLSKFLLDDDTHPFFSKPFASKNGVLHVKESTTPKDWEQFFRGLWGLYSKVLRLYR